MDILYFYLLAPFRRTTYEILPIASYTHNKTGVQIQNGPNGVELDIWERFHFWSQRLQHPMEGGATTFIPIQHVLISML